MVKRIYVMPGEGRTLRNHQNAYKLIPAEGALVEQDVTFIKRIKDGDAILIPEAVKPSEPKSEVKPIGAATEEAKTTTLEVRKDSKSKK